MSADNRLGRGLRALEGGLSGLPRDLTPGIMARSSASYRDSAPGVEEGVDQALDHFILKK